MPRARVNFAQDSGDLLHLAVYRLCDSIMVANHTTRPDLQASMGETLAKVLEANAQGMHPRLTVTASVGSIHYETSRYAVFMAVTSADYPQRTAFKAIGELRQQFEGRLGDELHKAEEGGLSKDTRPLMAELCSKYADPSKVDKTLGVLKQVDEVRGIMGQSIQALLATNEALEVLEDRSVCSSRPTLIPEPALEPTPPANLKAPYAHPGTHSTAHTIGA